MLKGALGESLLWQCRGFGTRVLHHRGPVVACKPSLWPHLLQSSNLFTVSEFLTTIECRGFIQAAEARGLEHQGSLGPARGEAFRDNERLAVSDPSLAQKLWNGGLEKLFKDVTIEGKLAVGLNPNTRFYTYVCQSSTRGYEHHN